MKRYPTPAVVAALVLVASIPLARPLHGANAIVGTGTPASCSDAALDVGIAAVNAGGGTLSFDCGAAPHTIVVTSAKTLSADATILGNGKITLSGGLGTRLFTTASGTDVTLDRLVLTPGFANAAPGGAILVQGAAAVGDTRLSLLETTVRDSVAGTWGGGIAAVNATVSLDHSSVVGNSAGGGGGGINLNTGVLSLYVSRIAGNLAAGDGGGIELWSGVIGIVESAIDDNQTATPGGTGSGGGIAVRDLSSGSVESSRIARNKAEAGGGGVYVWGNSLLYLAGVELRDNAAPAGVGGGLLIDSGAEVATGNLLVARNSAVQGGGVENNGGRFRLGNGTLAENRAIGGTGGAISNSGDLELIHVTIARNAAAIGGGIWSTDVGAPVTDLENVLFSGNTASTQSPDCHFLAGPSTLTFSLWPGTSCGSSSAGGNQPNTIVALPPLALTCAAPGAEPTATLLPAAGSAAVDTASCILPSYRWDARGVERPQGIASDVGAVEVSAQPGCKGMFFDSFESGATVRWDFVAN